MIFFVFTSFEKAILEVQQSVDEDISVETISSIWREHGHHGDHQQDQQRHCTQT